MTLISAHFLCPVAGPGRALCLSVHDLNLSPHTRLSAYLNPHLDFHQNKRLLRCLTEYMKLYFNINAFNDEQLCMNALCTKDRQLKYVFVSLLHGSAFTSAQLRASSNLIKKKRALQSTKTNPYIKSKFLHKRKKCVNVCERRKCSLDVIRCFSLTEN